MKIAIVGYGIEGKAAYNYWNKPENSITICDQNPDLAIPADTMGQLGADYLAGLEQFDLIVRSPFVRPDTLIDAASVDIIPKITSNTNEFMRVSPSRNIIGVTGTKGKGTTSTLIAQMLRAAGNTVHLGGNIGVAALDLLKSNILPDDIVVLELSSFQLIDLDQSPHTAVCLMVVPEHLDWHTDFQEYIAAKQQLFRRQTETDTTVYYAANKYSVAVSEVGLGRRIPYMQSPGAYVFNGVIIIDDHEICTIDELQILGEHNWQNVCAALTVVWQIIQDTTVLREVIINFTGLEHRLELVREFNGVHYYDDSFGTTPETAIVAIEAFEEPKVVILGGSDKGASYDELARVVAAATIRKVLLIGDQAPRIQAALDAVGFTNYQPGGETMKQIVDTARQVSQPGDVVLLSTGCASFGMFTDYKDRGSQFKVAVQALVQAAL